MNKNYRKLLSAIIFIVLTFGIMVPLYVHYTARQFAGSYDTLYLSKHSPYNTIIIEIHYQEGAEPSVGSLSLLKERIEHYTGKNVTMVKYPDIGDEEIPYIVKDNEVTRLGNRIHLNHTQYRTGWFSGHIMIYITYTNAKWWGEMNYSAAGMTYNADSIMIFKEVVHEPEIETSVLLHEMGHLWGLPDSNYTDDIMNKHLEEYLMSYIFDELPNDFSENDKKILLEKHDSWIIIPIKPYEPLYSVVLNHVDMTRGVSNVQRGWT